MEAPAGYQSGGVQAGAGAVGWGEGQSSGATGVVGKRSTPPPSPAEPQEEKDGEFQAEIADMHKAMLGVETGRGEGRG